MSLMRLSSLQGSGMIRRSFSSTGSICDSLSARLKDPSLLKTQSFVGGKWISAYNGNLIKVENPATGEIVAEVSECGSEETRDAIAVASEAFKTWSVESSEKRADLMRKWHALVLEAQEDFAAIMTAEAGKPLAEARGEFVSGVQSIEWFAEEAKRVEGETLTHPIPGKKAFTLRSPVGVVGSITPWNFPFSMITRKVSPAIAAGCTVVLKPSELTPLSALALAELAQRAGIPDGVLNVVVGGAREIGGTILDSEVVRKIGFTGSTRVGRLLMEGAAPSVKRVSLELGGNAPFLVFEDADVAKAAKLIVASSLRNSGQTCICTNRVLVHESVHDALAAALVEECEKIVLGDGFEPGTTQGPLINAAGRDKVEAQIADGLKRGGRVLTGGKRPVFPEGSKLNNGYFYEPTVVVDAPVDSDLFRVESFGPVTPLFRFKTEEEAIALANGTEFGLAAYVATNDLSRALRLADRIETGMLGINEAAITSYVAPFGGVKHSGLGRENSKHGIAEYLDMKTVVIGL